MKVVRTSMLVAVACCGASVYGQQAAELDQSAPQTAQQGQGVSQQQGLQDLQSDSFRSQQGQLGQQSTQLAPPSQQGQAGQPSAHQHQFGQQSDPTTRPPGQPGGAAIANEGQRGVLGVVITESVGPGVTIREVMEGSAAAVAGLEPGDVILQINGEGVTSPPAVTQTIREMAAGQQVMLSIWRDGQEQEIPATLQAAAQRDGYRANFRGSEGESMNGDSAARIQRLESQLAMVMQELQRLRQEVMQLRAAPASQSSGAAGLDSTLQQDPSQPGLRQPDALGSGLEQSGAAQTPLDQTDAQSPGLEEPAAETESTEADPALPF